MIEPKLISTIDNRKNFTGIGSNPYEDAPQLLCKGQTISAPHMHAHALETLVNEASRDSARVLDVGIGSGYLSAAFARLNSTAHVTGIDVVPDLVNLARENILKEDPELMNQMEIPTACNGWEGYANNAPYDAIHVGAAAAALPKHLLEQLKVGGKMVIPVGPDGGNQVLMQVVRTSGNASENGEESGKSFEQQFEITNLMGVRYVPLVGGMAG